MGKRVYSHILPLLLFPSLLFASYSPQANKADEPEESTNGTDEPSLNAPSFPERLLSSLSEGLSLDVEGAIDLGGVPARYRRLRLLDPWPVLSRRPPFNL